MSGIRSKQSVIERIGLNAFALLVAIVVASISLFVHRDAIATLKLPDADDAMRLAQVRDLLAGQGWFDVRQYRVDPAGDGGLMHWSRFIDLQIAGLIAFLRPFLGAEAGERWGAGIFPLLLLLPLFVLLARIFEALGGRRLVVAGLLLAATGLTFLHFFAPLRIDHHGWQLLLSVAMLWLSLGSPSFLRGLAAAFVITIHSEISIEGLPYLVLFGGIFAFEWLRDPTKAARLTGFAAGLLVFPVPWLLAFRGWNAMTSVYCDSFSAPYLAGVIAAAAILLVWLRGPAVGSGSPGARLAGLMLAAGGAAAAVLWLGQACFSGPFSELEPLVRTHWYGSVTEGRPLWQLPPIFTAVSLVPTLVGLGVAGWAWQRARSGPLADNWTSACLAFVGSALLSIAVVRTGAVAHAFLLPAYAVLALAIWDWAEARRTMIGRFGGALAVLLASPSAIAFLASQAVELAAPAPAVQTGQAGVCPTPAMLSKLGAAAPARLFAPIDIGPALLVRTPHAVVATGHHRNHAAMNRVIAAFVALPATSEAIVRGDGAAYLVLCIPVDEVEGYARANRHGLAARLMHGEPVDWLVRDAGLSEGALHVYRVVNAPSAPAD